MSEVRISASQPQAPAFQPKVTEAAPEAPSKGLSASKASKPISRKPKVRGAQYLPTDLGQRQPKYLANVSKAECQVLLNSGTQCSNPWNHTLSNGRGSCSNHSKRIATL